MSHNSALSAPPSPRGRGAKETNSVLEIKVEHLQHQLIMLKLELESRDRRSRTTINASEARAKAALDKLKEDRQHMSTARDRETALLRTLAKLEARNLECEKQIGELTMALLQQPPEHTPAGALGGILSSGGKAASLPPDVLLPLSRANSQASDAPLKSEPSSTKIQEDDQLQEQRVPLSIDLELTKCTILDDAPSIPPHSTHTSNIDCVAPCATVPTALNGLEHKRPPLSPSRPAVSARRIPTYNGIPEFIEIRNMYRNVLHQNAAAEDPMSRWVRNVMSSASAVDTTPKRVEPVVEGLISLCEQNGIPLPLHRLGPCQYQLGKRGAKLGVKLVNGRLMARSGPSYVDVFEWLERQPLPSLVDSP